MSKTLTLAACIAASAISSAHAQSIYATNTLAPTADNSDELIVFDAEDPASYQVIGSTGLAGIGFGGLAFDDQGQLYAYASLYKATSGAASGLYTVDTQTGIVTLVGDFGQTLQDIAFNPVDGVMYGINTRFGAQSTLFSIDLETGALTDLGLMTGLPTQHHLGGLSISSQGEFIIHDVVSDALYKGDGDSFSLLYTLKEDTSFSQGMEIDWSRGDKGYHASVGFGIFPDYFSTVNTFSTDGSDYQIGLPFGPNDPEGVPPVQPGDLAISPFVCQADLTGDGTLDVFDVFAFLDLFNAGDLAADMNNDSVLDVFDVFAYLDLFNTGCPS